MRLTDIGEFGLHAWLKERFGSPRGSLFGVGDDAALVELDKGCDVLISTDRVSLSNLADQSGAYVGKFAVLQNFSDIICKGGEPCGFLLVTLLQRGTTVDYFEAIVTGAAEQARAYGATLIGGDTKEHEVNTIVGVAIGTVRRGKAVSRDGARQGDVVAVSLTNGAKIGWRWARHVVEYFGIDGLPVALVSEIRSLYVNRSALPYDETRSAIATGQVRSCIDMTDGLGDSLRMIGEQSGVGFLIDEVAVRQLVDPALQPVADRIGVPLIKFAWSPGFDWENLFTIDADSFDQVRETVRSTGGDLVPIGRVHEESGTRIRFADGTVRALVPFSGGVFKSSPRGQQARLWAAHVDYSA